MFIGREEELAILSRRYDSDRFEFGYIYGQRRIGKTCLVDEFAKNKKALVLFAGDSDDKTIRDDFTSYLAQASGRVYGSFKSWDDFFIAVSEYFGDTKGFLVIDEYPNIVLTRDGKRKKTDFVSKLQNAIDRVFSKQRFLLVLTGSNVSFMEKEVSDTKAPLYERNTFQLFLTKLDWVNGVTMIGGMDLQDRIKTLCLTDTFPFYLSNIDVNASFDENLDRLFFGRDALFVSDPSKLLTSEIEANGLYSGIMRNLAAGHNTITALANVLDVDSAVVSVYLEKLIKNNVVSRHSMYNSKRTTFYKIIDRMTAFYFRFIHRNADLIKLGYGQAIKERERNAIDNFIHLAFEDVCISYLEHLNRHLALGDLFPEFQNYHVENSVLGRSIELDIVSSTDTSLLVGECKLSSSKKGIEILSRMKENISVPPFNNFKNVCYYIFSSSGFDNDLLAKHGANVNLIDLAYMLEISGQ